MAAQVTAQEATEFFEHHGWGVRVNMWWMYNVGVDE